MVEIALQTSENPSPLGYTPASRDCCTFSIRSFLSTDPIFGLLPTLFFPNETRGNPTPPRPRLQQPNASTGQTSDFRFVGGSWAAGNDWETTCRKACDDI